MTIWQGRSYRVCCICYSIPCVATMYRSKYTYFVKKKEKTTPRVASVVASATSGRPSSHGPTQQRKQIGLVQFASLDSPARRHSCRSVFPIGRPQTAVAQIGDRLIVTFDSGIARHRASLFRTQSTKASPAIQDASTNRRKAPNSRKVSIFY